MNDLSEKAKLLLKAAISSPFRSVMCARNSRSGTVQFIVNKENLIKELNDRDIADWESALAELITKGLLKKTDASGSQTFKVTSKGYECAKSLGL